MKSIFFEDVLSDNSNLHNIVIESDFFKSFLQETSLEEKILRLCKNLEPTQHAKITEVSKLITASINRASLPKSLKEKLLKDISHYNFRLYDINCAVMGSIYAKNGLLKEEIADELKKALALNYSPSNIQINLIENHSLINPNIKSLITEHLEFDYHLIIHTNSNLNSNNYQIEVCNGQSADQLAGDILRYYEVNPLTLLIKKRKIVKKASHLKVTDEILKNSVKVAYNLKKTHKQDLRVIFNVTKDLTKLTAIFAVNNNSVNSEFTPVAKIPLISGTSLVAGEVSGIVFKKIPSTINGNEILVLKSLHIKQCHLIYGVAGVIIEDEFVSESVKSFLSRMRIPSMYSSKYATSILDRNEKLFVNFSTGKAFKYEDFQSYIKPQIGSKSACQALSLSSEIDKEVIIDGNLLIIHSKMHPLSLSQKDLDLYLDSSSNVSDIIYKFCTLNSNSLTQLKGGHKFPHLSCSLDSFVNEGRLYQKELELVQSLTYKKLYLILPPIGTIEDFKNAKLILAKHNLQRSSRINIIQDISSPNLFLNITDFIAEGVDGFYIDLEKSYQGYLMNNSAELNFTEDFINYLKLGIKSRKSKELYIEISHANNQDTIIKCLSLGANFIVSKEKIHFEKIAIAEEKIVSDINLRNYVY